MASTFPFNWKLQIHISNYFLDLTPFDKAQVPQHYHMEICTTHCPAAPGPGWTLILSLRQWFLITQINDMIAPQTFSLETILKWRSYLTSYSGLEMFPSHTLCFCYRSSPYHISMDYYNSLLTDLLVSDFVHITFLLHFPHLCQSKVIQSVYIYTYTQNKNLTKPLS